MIAVKTVKVRVQRNPGATDLPLPHYQTDGAAGMDLCADVTEDVTIAPGEIRLVSTGLSISLPHGYEAQIRPRSGLSLKHGVTLINSPGTIDSDYRGEIKVPLINHGTTDFIIKRGDRIAQMIVAAVARATLEEVAGLDDTARGNNGFGSSGIR